MTKQDLISLYNGTSVKAEGIYEAQLIASACMKELSDYLISGLTRKEIHDHCEAYMLALGSEGWWIHNDPALVLFGNLTVFSAHEDPSPLFEGKHLEKNEMITVDVAPTVRGGWGDMTRTFFLRDGLVVTVEDTGNEEWIHGIKMEEYLHSSMLEFMTEDTSFSQLHAFTQRLLNEHGYKNCDYHGNFGHSIENDQKDRVTIIPDEHRSIAAYGKPFTYEPHICKIGSHWGFKHENMYAFVNGKPENIL